MAATIKLATHGVRRTNEDKRRAVMKLLQDAKWSTGSNREIAKHAPSRSTKPWR
jgi:hypothetical protein